MCLWRPESRDGAQPSVTESLLALASCLCARLLCHGMRPVACHIRVPIGVAALLDIHIFGLTYYDTYGIIS